MAVIRTWVGENRSALNCFVLAFKVLPKILFMALLRKLLIHHLPFHTVPFEERRGRHGEVGRSCSLYTGQHNVEGCAVIYNHPSQSTEGTKCLGSVMMLKGGIQTFKKDRKMALESIEQCRSSPAWANSWLKIFCC